MYTVIKVLFIELIQIAQLLMMALTFLHIQFCQISK